ncbi:hypothetical protein ACS0TY_025668 [Phlomoides rotata]
MRERERRSSILLESSKFPESSISSSSILPECRHRTNCTNSVDISEVADVGAVSAVQGTTMIAEQSCVVTHEEGKSAENNLYVVEGTARICCWRWMPNKCLKSDNSVQILGSVTMHINSVFSDPLFRRTFMKKHEERRMEAIEKLKDMSAAKRGKS